jgi:ABC-2 type transport system ATP-binding protein
MVDRLRDLGTTILLTTHYMDEAEHLADRLVVINRGRVVAQGTAEQLAARAGVETIVSFRLPDDVAPAGLPAVGTRVTLAGSTAEVHSAEPTSDVHRLTQWALDRGVELADLRLARPDLEDVYLELTDGGDPVVPAP